MSIPPIRTDNITDLPTEDLIDKLKLSRIPAINNTEVQNMILHELKSRNNKYKLESFY